MEAEEGASPPVNQNPEVVANAYTIVVGFLQAYGWFVLLGIAALMYVRHKLSPTIEEWRRKREQQQTYAFDATVSERRHEAMEASRQRLQQQLDAQAAKYKEQQEKREEEKRHAKIDDWQRHQEGKGYRSKVKSQDEASTSNGQRAKPRKPTTYRDNDYSPLMGGGGGGGYCPPRRGGGGGGG